MSSRQEDHLIGRLSLHYKLITQDQLGQATLQQSREGGRRKLGEILVESGVLPQRRFEQLLVAQQELLAKRQAVAAPEPQGSAIPSLSGPAPAHGRRIDLVLAYAVREGASDVHLHSGAPLRLRRHGRMTDVEPTNPVIIDRDTAERAIREILAPEQQAILDEHGQVDLAYTVPGVARFRGNVYRQQRGWDAVFRTIP